MTREEIMGLTGRELDFAVGREVMGLTVRRKGNEVLWAYALSGTTNNSLAPAVYRTWKTEAAAWDDTPNYTADANALRDMEAAIQSSEIKFLQNYYLLNLLEILDTESEPGYWRNTSQGVSLECLVLVRFASPTDCCRAALLAVTETQI